MATLRETNKYLQMPNAGKMIENNVRTSTMIETGYDPLKPRPGKMPAYDLDQPENAADWLLAMPKGSAQDWAKWLEAKHGAEFMEQVRTIAREKKKARGKVAKPARDKSPLMPAPKVMRGPADVAREGADGKLDL